jgi:hypothetical protein
MKMYYAQVIPLCRWLVTKLIRQSIRDYYFVDDSGYECHGTFQKNDSILFNETKNLTSTLLITFV